MLNTVKLKITAVLVCLFQFLLPSLIFAEADGVSIKWISPETEYKRISDQPLGESGTVKFFLHCIERNGIIIYIITFCSIEGRREHELHNKCMLKRALRFSVKTAANISW